MWSQRLARAWGSRPVVGSSRKTRVGSWIRPITMSRRRFWPPDMFLHIRRHRPSSCSSSKSSLAARRGVGLRHPVEHAVVDDLVAGEGAGEGAAGLGHVADAAPHLRGLADHVVPGDGGGARRGLEQGGQHPQCGGLAGAVRAEERDDLALLDVEVDAVDGADLGLGLAAPGVERLHESSCVDHGASSQVLLEPTDRRGQPRFIDSSAAASGRSRGVRRRIWAGRAVRSVSR